MKLFTKLIQKEVQKEIKRVDDKYIFLYWMFIKLSARLTVHQIDRKAHLEIEKSEDLRKQMHGLKNILDMNLKLMKRT